MRLPNKIAYWLCSAQIQEAQKTVDAISKHAMDVCNAQRQITENFQNAGESSLYLIEHLYAETYGLMPEPMQAKWRAELGLPVKSAAFDTRLTQYEVIF